MKMKKKSRLTVHDFPKNKEEKIKLFNDKNELLKTSLYSNQKYKSINMVDYFKLIFGRPYDTTHVLSKYKFNNFVIPFEEKMSESVSQTGYVYNNIAIELTSSKNKNWIITKELKELENLKGKDFVISAPVTYVGRNRNQNNSRFLYGIVIDLDYVLYKNLLNLLHQISIGYLPNPNLVTNSGNGFHLYYLLDEPIPLYKKTLEILNKLKHGLIDKIWNQFTSLDDTRQYQSIIQGYRLPETKTKFQTTITSFINLESCYTNISKLNEYISDNNSYKLSKDEISIVNQIKNGEFNYSQKLEEAKEKWPEWYQRRIIEKQPRKYITFKKDLYNWWLRIISDPVNVKVGHRYFCAMALVSYATKCNVSKEEVSKDLYSLLPGFDGKTFDPDNHFEKEDIEDALNLYGTNIAHNLTREYISTQTGISIKKNKRNGRTREEHLKGLHAINKIKGELYGYPKHKKHETKAYKILVEYFNNNPLAYSPKKIALETGLKVATVERNYKQIINKMRAESPKDETSQLKQSERSLYYLIKQNPNMTKKELANVLGVSYRTVLRKYDKLYNLYMEQQEKHKLMSSIFKGDEE